MNNFKSFLILILAIVILNDNAVLNSLNKKLLTFFEDGSVVVQSQKNKAVKSKNIYSIETKPTDKKITVQQPSKVNLEKYFAQISALDINSSESNKTIKTSNLIEKIALNFIGHKYVWGGTTPKGFDCSGFTKYVFAKVGYLLPRTALEQSKEGFEISETNFKKGDLLYFNTDKSRGIPVSHVGIYLEDGKFIHAANKKKGVIISTFKSYKKTFVRAKRLIEPTQKMVTASSRVNPTSYSTPKTKRVTSFMSSYDPFVIYEGRYIRQSKLSQRKE